RMPSHAIKEQTPKSLFFTTDLDAILEDPAQYDWTRNLIVASSFGLELNEGLQRDIPPFRDTYQTSAFLATRLALQDNHNTDGKKHIEDLLQKPRIFESGRSGAVDLAVRSNALCYSIADCENLHPRKVAFHPYLTVAAQRIIALSLIVLFVALTSLKARRFVRDIASEATLA